MRFLLSILFLLFSGVVFPQEQMRAIDSMQRVVAGQTGEERVRTLIELSKEFYDVSFDDCISIGEQAVGEAERLDDVPLKSEALWKLGVRYMYHYEFDLAQDYLAKAFQLMPENEISENRMFILNCLGRINLLQGIVDSAIVVYQEAFRVSEALGDELNCADVTNNLAFAYFQKGDSDEALSEFYRAREWFVQLEDTLSVAQCDNNIGLVYINRNQYEEAKSILAPVESVFRSYGDIASLASLYQNLGVIYTYGIVDYDSAMYFYSQSMEYAAEVGDAFTLIDDKLEKAVVLLCTDNQTEAFALLNEALNQSEEIGYVPGRIQSLAQLGIYYYNEKADYARSLEMITRCLALEESVGMNLRGVQLRPYLILDYAHLGLTIEMEKELKNLSDDYSNALMKNGTSWSENDALRRKAESIVNQNEELAIQNETYSRKMKAYRLAFFGLLALVSSILLGVVVLRKRKR